MKIIYIFILTLIRFCFSCEDVRKVSFYSPYNDAKDIQFKKNDDINIVCCHPDGASHLKWRNKDGKQILNKNENGTFSLKDEKNRLILRIDNFDKNGVGTYTCENSKRDLYKSITISLEPLPMRPIFTKIEEFFPKNKPIHIKCPLKPRQSFESWTLFDGKKNLELKKSSKGMNFEISEDILTFTIINGTDGSIKSLWCKYQEYNDGSSTGFYEFTWQLYDPIDVKIVLEKNGPILEGDDVKMICSFNFYLHQTREFPYNNHKSKFIVDDRNVEKGILVLIIPKITENLKGEYLCRITNFVFDTPVSEIAKIKIDIIVPPKIKKNLMEVTVNVDKNAYLKCFIISEQLNEREVSFERLSLKNSTWIMLNTNKDKYKIDFIRKSNDINLTLTIKNVQWEDRGKYRCSASNAAGKVHLIGMLKVNKDPILYTESTSITIAMEPVKVDCSVSGFPIYIDDVKVTLNVINDSLSAVKIKFLESIIDEMEGVRYYYKVSHQRKLSEGTNYILECFYHNSKTQVKRTANIELKIASRPDVPKVSVLCTGSSGVVFQYDIPEETQTTKDVKKNELFYAPSIEFDELAKKPSKIIPITEENKSKKFFIYVLKSLMPSTNYSFKWDSYNIFQISNSINLVAETKKLSPPKTPKSLEFSTEKNVINVNVKWDDECPYPGANGVIKDAVVKIKHLTLGNEKATFHWQWIETNFTLEVEKKSLQFPISLEKPHVNYEIEVVLRSAQGTSEPIVAVYKAEIVLAGSLYSCFPRCLGQSLSSSLIVLQSVLIVYLVSLSLL